jgi:hypothetical protein
MHWPWSVPKSETGQGVGKYVCAGESEPIHGASGDNQGLGGVKPTRNPDDGPGAPGGSEPHRQALDLDIVGLVAVFTQSGGVRRHEREAVKKALKRDRLRRQVERKGNRVERGCSFRFLVGTIAEWIDACAPGGCARDRHRRG